MKIRNTETEYWLSELCSAEISKRAIAIQRLIEIGNQDYDNLLRNIAEIIREPQEKKKLELHTDSHEDDSYYDHKDAPHTDDHSDDSHDDCHTDTNDYDDDHTDHEDAHDDYPHDDSHDDDSHEDNNEHYDDHEDHGDPLEW